MSTHPAPKELARQLRDLATLLDHNGHHALELADALAARGYPSATGGNGSRTSSNSTSVERAAGTHSDSEEDDNKPTRRPGRWANANTDLAAILDHLTTATRLTDTYIADLFDHASDEDWLPAGTGNCACCGNFVRPDYKRPNNRIVSGYCPACHQAWIRWRRTHYPERAAYERSRRADLLKKAEQREAKQRIGA